MARSNASRRSTRSLPLSCLRTSPRWRRVRTGRRTAPRCGFGTPSSPQTVWLRLLACLADFRCHVGTAEGHLRMVAANGGRGFPLFFCDFQWKMPFFVHLNKKWRENPIGLVERSDDSAGEERCSFSAFCSQIPLDLYRTKWSFTQQMHQLDREGLG